MNTLDVQVLAHVSHSTGSGGTGAVLSFAVLLAGAGIGATYVADTALLSPAEPTRPAGTRAIPVAAGACLISAGLSAAAVGEHLGAAAAHTVLFIAVAAVQLLLALLLLRMPNRRVLRAAVAVSAWLVLLWLVTRTMGVALLTQRLPFGVLDTLASGLALLVLAGCRSALHNDQAVDRR